MKWLLAEAHAAIVLSNTPFIIPHLIRMSLNPSLENRSFRMLHD